MDNNYKILVKATIRLLLAKHTNTQLKKIIREVLMEELEKKGS